MKKNRTITVLVGVLVLCVVTAPAMAADFWTTDSDIVSGLGDVGHQSSPTVFYKDGTWYLISGEGVGVFYGYNWTGSTWQPDPAIVSGLGCVGDSSSPAVFCKGGTWFLISGEMDGWFYGYKWNGSTWQSDPAIVSGLGNIGYFSKPAVFCKDGTRYLISGEHQGFHGFHWTGSTWQPDSAIVSGLGDVGSTSNPAVFNKSGIWYLISGEGNGVFSGFHWTGSTWQPDSALVSGLGGVGLAVNPTVFYKDMGWYLISGDGRGVFHGWHANPRIEVNKTVWDSVNETWVKEITTIINDNLRFRCVIHNPEAYNLTNITVVDILSDSLKYNDSATVNGVPHEPVKVGSNEYEWNFTRLEPCQSITIEFNGSAISCGNDTNIQNATAWYAQTGEWVSAKDSVNVSVRLGICGDVTGDGEVGMGDVIKLLWNQTYAGQYPVGSWAADVTGDGEVGMGDVIKLLWNQTYAGQYPLTCK